MSWSVWGGGARQSVSVRGTQGLRRGGTPPPSARASSCCVTLGGGVPRSGFSGRAVIMKSGARSADAGSEDRLRSHPIFPLSLGRSSTELTNARRCEQLGGKHAAPPKPCVPRSQPGRHAPQSRDAPRHPRSNAGRRLPTCLAWPRLCPPSRTGQTGREVADCRDGAPKDAQGFWYVTKNPCRSPFSIYGCTLCTL